MDNLRVKDIMIGNWLENFLGEKFQVNQGTMTYFGTGQFPRPKPIQLTEKILLNNCKGFKIIKPNKKTISRSVILTHNHYMFGIDSLHIKVKANTLMPEIIFISLICNTNFINHLIYVHELQNWFKLITKQELEINF